MDGFDPDYLLSNLDGDRELAAEIVGVFMKSSPETMDGIRRAVGAGDAEALHRTAHQLKGALANIGAHTASAAAARLEQVGKRFDMGEAGSALEILDREMARLDQQLEALFRLPG